MSARTKAAKAEGAVDLAIKGVLLLIAELSERVRAVEARLPVADEPDGPGWCSIKQAAHAVGVSRQAVHQWVQLGQVLARRKGSAPYRVELASVQARAALDTLHLLSSRRRA